MNKWDELKLIVGSTDFGVWEPSINIAYYYNSLCVWRNCKAFKWMHIHQPKTIWQEYTKRDVNVYSIFFVNKIYLYRIYFEKRKKKGCWLNSDELHKKATCIKSYILLHLLNIWREKKPLKKKIILKWKTHHVTCTS